MNTRAIGVRLQYAPANVRALIVNALREKATVDREAAAAVDVDLDPDEDAPDGPGYPTIAATLNAQADLAEQVAEELEGA